MNLPPLEGSTIFIRYVNEQSEKEFFFATFTKQAFWDDENRSIVYLVYDHTKKMMRNIYTSKMCFWSNPELYDLEKPKLADMVL